MSSYQYFWKCLRYTNIGNECPFTYIHQAQQYLILGFIALATSETKFSFGTWSAHTMVIWHV